jgi:hypothetical protein
LEYLPKEKVVLSGSSKHKRSVPSKAVKYDERIVAENTATNITDIREDYSDDPELYAAIGLLMKRANISG